MRFFPVKLSDPIRKARTLLESFTDNLSLLETAAEELSRRVAGARALLRDAQEPSANMVELRFRASLDFAYYQAAHREQLAVIGSNQDKLDAAIEAIENVVPSLESLAVSLDEKMPLLVACRLARERLNQETSAIALALAAASQTVQELYQFAVAGKVPQPEPPSPPAATATVTPSDAVTSIVQFPWSIGESPARWASLGTKNPRKDGYA